MRTTATDRYLSLGEVGEVLGVSTQSVRRWVKNGELPAVKPGKEWRIRESDLDEFLEARSTPKAQRGLFEPPSSEQAPAALAEPQHVLLGQERRTLGHLPLLEGIRTRYQDLQERLEPYLTHWEKRLENYNLDRASVEEFLQAAGSFSASLRENVVKEVVDLAIAHGLFEKEKDARAVYEELVAERIHMKRVFERHCDLATQLQHVWNERYASEDDAELAEVIDFQEVKRKLRAETDRWFKDVG